MALAHEYVAVYPSGATDPISDDPQGDAGASYSASYTSLASALAGEVGDYTGGDGTVLHIEIIPSDGSWASADTTVCTFDGWKTDKSGDGSYIEIKAYGTARHSGVRSTTAYRLHPSSSSINLTLVNDDSATDFLDLVLDGIQIFRTSGDYRLIYITNGGYYKWLEFTNLYLYSDVSSRCFSTYISDTTNCEIRLKNSVIEHNASASDRTVRYQLEAKLFYMINCTVFNNGNDHTIENDDNSNSRYVNIALFNNNNDFRDSFPAGYPLYCASDEGAGEGTNGLDISGTWDSTCFTDPEASPPDVNIQDTDSPLYHAGETQNNEPEIPATDIAGNTRPTGDSQVSIGAFEYAEELGVTIPLLWHHYDKNIGARPLVAE